MKQAYCKKHNSRITGSSDTIAGVAGVQGFNDNEPEWEGETEVD